MNGMAVAMIVMNWTFVSSGRPAMWTMVDATWAASNVGSARLEPSACGTPEVMRAVISVAALPMSICEQAMLNGRPSSYRERVRPVIACFVAV
jgi:hypothetical protein